MWAGANVTVVVVPAGTVTRFTRWMFVPGRVIDAVRSVVWAVPVLFRTSALIVRSEALRSLALCWTTWLFRTETGPSCLICGANWRPVQPSGDFGFQSTMSMVR